jgi:N,N-dimethylformamidase
MQPELTGYPDQWSAAPGQTIRFMVSTDADAYDVSFVRLIQADDSPAAPPVKEQVVAIGKRYPGRKQVARAGSYVAIEGSESLDLTSFTFTAWIYPTLPRAGHAQTLIGKGDSFAVYIDEDGCLNLRTGRVGANRVSTRTPLHERTWYFVAAAYDADSGTARLVQYPVQPIPRPAFAPLRLDVNLRAPEPNDAPLLIAAAGAGDAVYNGKIDRPRLYDRALSTAEIDSLRGGAAPETLPGLLADWDFSTDITSARVTNRGGRGLHGHTVNMPMRGVTGYNWTGREVDYRLAPAQYGAIHFHDDDLDNARWEADFELTIPAEWKSGIYSARLKAGDLSDDIVFVVRPPVGKPSASIAYLLPTMTYMAYANYRTKDRAVDEYGKMREPLTQPLETHLDEHPELAMSLYDLHTDGSGCCYSSRLRPIPSMRPTFRWSLVGGLRHFAADLYLEDWLEEKDFAHDVITDEDLHHDGQALLASYKVIITGTHPEYWTMPMMDALQAYLASGGKLMYLGGNGFYWVTSLDPERPHICEVRRGITGTRAWESAPGESYTSTTSEIGGLWRHRGRAPNRVAGIGFTAQGWDGRAPGYQRQPGSFDPRAAFIFEGIGSDEVIGDFGLGLGGAAGDELDRVDAALGTPPQTLVLASSSGHTDTVLPVIEDYNGVILPLMTREKWDVRSDIVYADLDGGGAFFSVGSISWCSSLPHNGYVNNVSRMTENVLRQFAR